MAFRVRRSALSAAARIWCSLAVGVPSLAAAQPDAAGVLVDYAFDETRAPAFYAAMTRLVNVDAFMP